MRLLNLKILTRTIILRPKFRFYKQVPPLYYRFLLIYYHRNTNWIRGSLILVLFKFFISQKIFSALKDENRGILLKHKIEIKDLRTVEKSFFVVV